ncbi:MAG TPA: protease pro-enzyme activation domain-containing protein [Opitutaceae bacterium]
MRPDLTTAEKAAALSFRISLRMRDSEGLAARVHAGEHVSAAELESRYLPSPADYQRLVAWAQVAGLEITLQDRNHTTLYLRAPIDRIERVLGTQFSRVGNGSQEFSSAVAPPTLPDEIAGPVLSVSGLQPERSPTRLRSRHVSPQLLKTSSYTYVVPSDVAAAYDFPAGLDGTGQTVAFVEDAIASNSELTTFWQTVGSPASTARVTVVQLDANPLTSQITDEPEAALDLEWVGSLAPAAQLRVYADADIFVGVAAALNDAPTHPGMTVLSFSYGGSESAFYEPSYSQTFLQLQAAGIAVVASSGEQNNIPGQPPQTGVNYPASDPSVTSVGGTLVEFNEDGSYGTDQPLFYSGTFSSGSLSGGYSVTSIVGPSAVFSTPAWQSSALGLAKQSDQSFTTTAFREVPDVSAFALGSVGSGNAFALDYDLNGEDAVFGTSVSAPVWAAVVTLLNQERARVSKPPLAALNAALYPVFNLSALNLPAPLSMPNTYSPPVVSGQPPSTPKYSYTTGLGRPDVAELILCLGDEFYSYCDQWASALPVGGMTELTAHAVGGTAQFQWQVNTGSGWSNLAEGANAALFSAYFGTQTATLTIAAQSGYPGSYRYRALATSGSGAVAPTGPVPVQLATPPTATIVEGLPTGPVQPLAQFNFQVSGSSANGVSYQWELNGQPIPNEKQADYYGFLTTASEGNYSVVVSDSRFPSLSVTVNLGYLALAEPDRIYHWSVLAGGNTRGYQDNTGAAAEFLAPTGIAVDPQGNVIVADSGNQAIRRITPAGVTTTVAGGNGLGSNDGIGTAAHFNNPTGVSVDSQGNIYVADTGNAAIRKIAPDGTVTTLAGGTPGHVDGQGTAAKFTSPTGLALGSGNVLHVLDTDPDLPASYLRTVTLQGQVGTQTTLPELEPGLAVDGTGAAYAADTGSIYRIGADGTLSTMISSQGSTVGAPFVNEFVYIDALAVDSSGRVFYGDFGGIRQLLPGGSPANVFTDTNVTYVGPILYNWGQIEPKGIACDQAGSIYYTNVSQGAEIDVARRVAFISQAVPGTPAAPGNQVKLAVTVASDAGASTFQWRRNGVAIPGATASTLTVGPVGIADTGEYTVAWTSPTGTSILGAGKLAIAPSDARITNLSARAKVGVQGNPLITGFVVNGDSAAAPKHLLLTGRGPVLAQFGIADFLPTPDATLYDGQSRPIASELSWSNPPSLASGIGVSPLATASSVTQTSNSLIQQVTGGSLPAGSADAVMACTLPNGAYTDIVSSADGNTGVALAEIFDADWLLASGGDESRLVNVSARAFVGTGDQVLIAGLVVTAGPTGGPETIMIRGQGPNLVNYGLLGVLDQTRITLYDGNSAPVASNVGWSNPPTYAIGASASPLATAGAGLQAATADLQQLYATNSFAPSSSDSALVVTLPPGLYTVILDNPDSRPGTGLLEVFELR